MAAADRAGAARAWGFVPLLYFLEGVPYVIVTSLSVLMYNKLGVPNDQIGLWTSLIAFPWTLKMLWGPLVDVTFTKRRWILGTQVLIALGLAVAVAAVPSSSFLTLTLAVFGVLAVLSATHDIAADGFYLLALGKKDQAFFVGVRSTFYRLATIFGTGFLVWLAGRLIALTPESTPQDGFSRALQSLDAAATPLAANDVARAWMLALGIGAAAYALLVVVNGALLPRPAADAPRPPEELKKVRWAPLAAGLAAVAAGAVAAAGFAAAKALYLSALVVVLATAAAALAASLTVPGVADFFRQRRILWILGFILFYRFGESMIGKMSGPFLQDPLEKGGLAIPTDQIGIISGTIGVLALTLGGILGGVVISRWGIKRCLWPMVLALNVPNLFYVWAAYARPDAVAVGGLIAVDQFGYGFGFSAYMVYLMFVSQGSEYQTSHYAIATGLMALGALLAGILSGFLQVQLGYAAFFVAVVFSTIPGMITLFFIPLDREDIYEAPVEID